MAWIETKTEQEANQELKQLFDQVRDKKSGQVDNILSVHSLHPAGLDAHNALYSAVMRPTSGLRKAEREMIALIVSQINQCHY